MAYAEQKEATIPDYSLDSPGGGGDVAGSGSGSQGTYSASDKKRVMQSYMTVIMSLYGKYAMTPAQQKLAERAFKAGFPASTYAEMLRRFDPKYVTTQDYKDRVQQAVDLYRDFRPGRPVPAGFVKTYAHSGMSLARLQARMEKSKWFKREFAGWTEAQKAGSAAGMSPQTFLNYRTMWNNALQRAYGRPASRLEQRMMFSSGMTGDEVYNNMTELFGGQEALKWATGQMLSRPEVIKGALTVTDPTGTLGKVRRDRASMAGYMGSENKQFDIDVDNLSNNLRMSRI